ncbi:hypothetical protein GF406_03530 [candidate division KSB1 bacterium]|nr:hypothetical protein [candidate division KSB1 bacterium]
MGTEIMLGEPLYITHLIAKQFEHQQIRYLVGGSLASSLHGIPRATQDVDMVAELFHKHISPLVQALKDSFFIDADMIHQAIDHGSSFNLIHLETMFKVDIFIMQKDLFAREEMAQRELYHISETSEQSLYIARAEDIILHKLYWYKTGNEISERQWTDALGVLIVQFDKLDFSYLKKGARHKNIEKLLANAIDQAKKKSDG